MEQISPDQYAKQTDCACAVCNTQFDKLGSNPHEREIDQESYFLKGVPLGVSEQVLVKSYLFGLLRFLRLTEDL